MTWNINTLAIIFRFISLYKRLSRSIWGNYWKHLLKFYNLCVKMLLKTHAQRLTLRGIKLSPLLCKLPWVGIEWQFGERKKKTEIKLTSLLMYFSALAFHSSISSNNFCLSSWVYDNSKVWNDDIQSNGIKERSDDQSLEKWTRPDKEVKIRVVAKGVTITALYTNSFTRGDFLNSRCV